MPSKSAIRSEVREWRSALSEAVRAEHDRAVAERLQKEIDWMGLKRVLIFLPIPARHEIDTWPLIRWIWEEFPSVEVLVPRVEGDVMTAVPLTPETELVRSSFGILEPVGDPIDERTEIDLVITPLLAFDDTGQRIGFGGGYYDKFFAVRPRSTRIGVGYEKQRLAQPIEAEDHDMPLDGVATERRMYRFSYSR